MFNLTNEEIINKVEEIGSKPMTIFSHGYEPSEQISIKNSALNSAKNYTKYSRSHPAIAIMDIVLAANRDYEKQVIKYVRRMRNDISDLTIQQLDELIGKHDYKSFKTVCGHADEKKFETLKYIVKALIKNYIPQSKENDFYVLTEWASKASIVNKTNDIIGRIPKVGIATYQHLKMTFGVDTVKPDLRVMQVLERIFDLKVSKEKSIEAVEEIAQITKYSALELDQIFVKYGSGYFRSEDLKVRAEVEKIITVLCELGVPIQQIAIATKWTQEEIAKVTRKK